MNMEIHHEMIDVWQKRVSNLLRILLNYAGTIYSIFQGEIPVQQHKINLHLVYSPPPRGLGLMFSKNWVFCYI